MLKKLLGIFAVVALTLGLLFISFMNGSDDAGMGKSFCHKTKAAKAKSLKRSVLSAEMIYEAEITSSSLKPDALNCSYAVMLGKPLKVSLRRKLLGAPEPLIISTETQYEDSIHTIGDGKCIAPGNYLFLARSDKLKNRDGLGCNEYAFLPLTDREDVLNLIKK